MAEWFKAAVKAAVVSSPTVGSNPTLSAKDAGNRKAQKYREFIALPTDLYTIWCDSFN